MAKRLSIPSKELQLVLVGPENSFKASRVQRLGVNTDVAVTQISEIGSASHAGQSKDVPNVTLTFSAMDVGVKIFSVLTGTDWTAYPGAGVDIVSLADVDAILYVKDATVAEYAKSAHVKRLKAQTLNLNYSVDGESTEDYTFAGAVRRWFKYDVVVDRFVSGTTSFNLTQTPIQLKNGDYALSVILDGEYLTEVDSAPATGEYSVSGTTVTTGDTRTSQVLVIYHADASASWSDVSDADMPAAVRGKDVAVTISANSIPRVQSVTITANLNSQPVNEMGNPEKTVGYQTDQPTVEGTITVLDTDDELMALFSEGEIAPSGVVEYNPGYGCTTTTLALVIELRDPCDTDEPYTVLKTVYLDEIAPIGDGYTVNVGGQAQWAVNFRSETGHLRIFSGAMA